MAMMLNWKETPLGWQVRVAVYSRDVANHAVVSARATPGKIEIGRVLFSGGDRQKFLLPVFPDPEREYIETQGALLGVGIQRPMTAPSLKNAMAAFEEWCDQACEQFNVEEIEL